jgi:deoxyribodipyrimidine photo-lyase
MVKSVFLFHRDLRSVDNTALIRACKESDEILAAFVFPPEQIDPSKNAYFSHPAVQFMCESLRELGKTIPIHFYMGENVATLQTIHSTWKFDRLYQNEDYSVYAKTRDTKIKTWCEKNKVEFCSYEDYGLFPLNAGLLPDGRPYTVLAQFYKRYLKELEVRKVDGFKVDAKKFVKRRVGDEMPEAGLRSLYEENPHIAQRGGRIEGLKILKRIKEYKSYKDTRDFPANENGTTNVSAHLKFGTVSIREMYWACVGAFGTRDHPLIRELIFREFYMKIYALRPEMQRGTAYHAALDKYIPWTYDKKLQKAWQTGTTGFPMVDAGMRQLVRENWCHNRSRMLVASVATKYLLLDWRDCARFFYTQLVDADTFSNTAGWGWASSTGVDATLYFRAPFNPFIQSKKFDIDAEYIKRYVQELQDVDAKDIHKWYDPKVRAKYPSVSYPAPIVDHKQASARALQVFKRAATAAAT